MEELSLSPVLQKEFLFLLNNQSKPSMYFILESCIEELDKLYRDSDDISVSEIVVWLCYRYGIFDENVIKSIVSQTDLEFEKLQDKENFNEKVIPQLEVIVTTVVVCSSVMAFLPGFRNFVAGLDVGLVTLCVCYESYLKEIQDIAVHNLNITLTKNIHSNNPTDLIYFAIMCVLFARKL
jgi:hypothetical protein